MGAMAAHFNGKRISTSGENVFTASRSAIEPALQPDSRRYSPHAVQLRSGKKRAATATCSLFRDSGLLDEEEPESTAEALARFNRRPLESKIRVTETSDRYDANVPTCSRPVVNPQNLRQAERATTVESMSSLRSAFGLCASPLWQLVQTVENFLHEGVGWIT